MRSRSLVWGVARSRVAQGLFVSGALAGQLFAQQVGSGADAGSLQEVVITGSRISYPGFVSPTPVSSLSESDLALGRPKLFDTLTALPKFRNSLANAGAIGLAGGSGGEFMNLRNFGSQRLLVLLDGMRLPVSTDRGIVDVSLIPDQLVSRVDVITGGASAAYGSDAVAGAVNYILDRDFEGFKAELAGGTSSHGDGTLKKIAAAYGARFAGDKGHLVASFAGFEQDGISSLNTNRDWFTAGAANLSSPSGQLPALVTYASGARYLATPAGVITSGPLAGTTFGPGGVPQPYVFGSPRDTNYQLGGDGAAISPPSIITTRKRGNGFVHAEYAISDSATLFAEGAAAWSRSERGDLQPLYNIAANAVTIFDNNAYLTPTMLARMQAAGVTSFRLENIWTDSPHETGIGTDTLYRVRGGMRGNFTSDWSYHGAVQISRSKLDAVYPYSMQWKHLYAAADAVIDPATGRVVCRSTLQGFTPDCVPINLMGPGSITPEAFNYVAGFAQHKVTKLDEVNVSLSSQRPVFKLWSEDSAILAAGIEYRSQDFKSVTNESQEAVTPSYTGIRGVPAGRIGNTGFDIGGFIDYTGQNHSVEGFAELNVPVIEGLPLVRKLSVNMAARYTKYHPAGPATTYKSGLVYEPVDALLVRASYSRDMRAPALFEAFQPRLPSSNLTVVTPFGVIPASGFTSGNRDLEPERAHSYTIGLVLQPEWLPGFGASIDYYHIKMEDGIAQAGSPQQLVNACYQDNSAFACGLLNVAPDRASMILTVPVINNTTQVTSGVDYEASYRRQVAGGQLSIRALASYTPKFTSAVIGAPVVNTAGQVTNTKWIGSAHVNYATGPATISLTARYIDSSLKNVTFREGTQINENDVPSVTYLDASFLYDFAIGQDSRPKYQAYLQIANLLDRDPPLVIGGGGAQVIYTNFNVYDGIGRYYTAGLRLRF